MGLISMLKSSFLCVPAPWAWNRNLKGRRKIEMSILKGRKAIVIGDRDGVPGMAIAACAESAGAEVVFSSTECFV